MRSYDGELVTCGDGKIEPIVTIMNMGSEVMTACLIQTIVDGDVINSFDWTGSLSTYGTDQVTLPEIPSNTSNVSFSVVMDGDIQASDDSIDIDIQEKDLRIDTYRSSGAGGQHVNTTDSAVRITHIPTGLSVSQQDEKSQHKNKAKGMKILRARLYELERSRIDQERSQDRKTKIGTGDRSERIRTYNFPQGRVTDHRINLTLHKLDEFLEGEVFDEMIESLTLQAQEESLSNLK